PSSVPAADRKNRLRADVASLLQDLSGYDLSAVDPATDLLALGRDSLLRTQAATLCQRRFGVPITFRQLMADLSSLHAIATHLDVTLPPDAAHAPAAVAKPAAVPVVAPAAIQVGGSVLEQLLAQQQVLTNQLLQLMGQQHTAVAAAPAPAAKPQ